MKFDRSALIGALNTAIQQEEAAVAAVRRRNKAADTEHRAEWMRLHSDGWMTAATAIQAKLRKGEPVTEHDIPRDRTGRGTMALYRARYSEPEPITRVSELKGLRAVLNAVADESVTSTSLRALGVSVNTLRVVVPLLGAASVRADQLKLMK